ncbi:MAG: SGNH/GDSL hydrolase family protein [Planctomycetota bacterium]
MMTRLLAAGAFAAALSLSLSAQFAAVMPIGDSITEADDGDATYRYFLWQSLLDDGHCVDFVGSRRGVRAGLPRFPNFDQDHEGHWGWRADEILGSMRGWVGVNPPDVVLIHLGTNDLWQGQSVPSTVAELGAIIDEIRVARSDVVVLLAQIIPVASSAGFSVVPLNNALPALAATKTLPSSPVILVDQWTGFDPDLHTYDGVHPNLLGEQKMAAEWYAALQAVLVPCTAEYAAFGNGCGGTGAPAPDLVASGGSRPVLGTTLQLQLTVIPGGLAKAGAVGASDATALGQPLPLSLTAAGLTGCHLLVSPDLVVPLPAAGSLATWPLPIPNQPSLVGTWFYLQGIAVQPPANPAGVVLSNGGAARIGQQ